jgi:hypothetical protein
MSRIHSVAHHKMETGCIRSGTSSGLKLKKSELDCMQECVPNDESNATLASSPEEDYTGTEELNMDEDQEDSDPDAGEGLDFSTEEDVDSDFGEGFNFTTDEDVDSDIGEEFGSDTDEYVSDCDLWQYADENILPDLTNVYEREKSNSDETKRREEEVALRVARSKARRQALYPRLMTEVMVVHLTPYSAWFLGGGGLCEPTGNQLVHNPNRLFDTCP